MSWQQVYGHDSVRERFAAAVRSGRLGHAYLFVGPEGIGKKRFAVELAKALLCEGDGGQFEACDQCAACHLVDAGTHPDLVVTGRLEESNDFTVDQMRELLGDLAMKPARGQRRIAIVDDVDDLNDVAANTFLKTLEEPPDGSLLILVGTEVDRQLVTIRSRCQVVAFRPLTDQLVEARLREAGIDDPTRLKKLIRLAAGSPGSALALADPDLWAARLQMLATVVTEKPNGPALAKTWMAAIEAPGKESAQLRRRAGQLLRLVADAYRQALSLAVGESNPNVNPDEAVSLKHLAAKHGVDGLIDRLDRILDAEMHLDRKVQLVLLVEALADALTLDAPPSLR